jgi:hypothetical protein
MCFKRGPRKPRPAEYLRACHPAVALVLLASFGCGGPKLEFAEVSGKVTLNAKAMAGVVVRFYPLSDKKEQLPPASAFTDELGEYTLRHNSKEPGALVGPNKVVVSWPSRDVLAAGGRGNAPGPPIPLRYTVVMDSPITVEVKPGGPQVIDLPLVDD